MMPRLFIDERTVLRPMLDSDASALYSVIDDNRARLRHWLPWLDGTRSHEDLRAFRSRMTAQEAEGMGLARVIQRDNALCGVIAFNHIDGLNRRAELGYWLGREYEGRGLCRRGSSLLIAHAFAELGLNRIAIAAAVGNRRSRALAERLGFTLEGVLRQAEWLYDHYVDHAVYGLLRAEWQQAASS
jgi:ribosomal-protein-serine acetyltransferase